MQNETKTNVIDSDVKVNSAAIEITKNQLIGKMIQQKGHTFIQLFATTDVKMNKGGRANTNYLHGNVIKDSEINAGIDFEYENAVNNALKRDGETPDFVVGERKWGKHMVIDQIFDIETLEFVPVTSRVIIEHIKDGEKRYYLQLAVRNSKKPTYRYKDTGKELSATDKEVMYSYMPPKKEEIVVLRDYRIDNVERIHINKVQYVLKK